MLTILMMAGAAAATPCWANGTEHRLEGRVRMERSVDHTLSPPAARDHAVFDLDRPICMRDRRMGTVHVRKVALRSKDDAHYPVGRHAAITGQVWQSLSTRKYPERVELIARVVAPGR